MIRIPKFHPPADFEHRIKNPGLRFLIDTPHPNNFQWRRHSYWRDVHDDLYENYNGICAFCATWTPRGRGSNDPDQMTSIDHFIPKSHNPTLAYEWENFRLCKARINANKGANLEIIDPQYIGGDWFIIDFNTFLINPNDRLPYYLEHRIDRTIEVLDLNHNDFVEQRVDIIKAYVLDDVTFPQLKEKFPFIAYEMVRQDFKNEFKDQMHEYFVSIS